MVEIVTLISEAAHSKLIHAVGAYYRIEGMGSAKATMSRLAYADRLFVLVVDPALPSSTDMAQLAQILMARSTGVLLYLTDVPLTTGSLRWVLRLARATTTEVVVLSEDDSPERVRYLIAVISGATLGRALLEHLRPQMHRVPQLLQHSIKTLYTQSNSIRTVRQLADASDMSRRSLDRTIRHAGFAPAHAHIAAARVLRAYTVLRGSKVPLVEAAAMLGCVSAQTLNEECRMLTGASLHRIRHAIEPAALVELLAAALVSQNDEP